MDWEQNIFNSIIRAMSFLYEKAIILEIIPSTCVNFKTKTYAFFGFFEKV